MTKQELAANIAILEHLGWFVGEVETDEFDALLECCRPDGSVLEQVPVTPFFVSLYEEEEGGLEERLWFFAPHYSTSLDNLLALLCGYKPLYEWNVSQQFYSSDYLECRGEVVKLKFDNTGDCYEDKFGVSYTQNSPAMALSVAFLKCEGLYHESDYCGEQDY